MDPRLLPEQGRTEWRDENGQTRESGKLAALTLLVPRITEERHRVLVFSQFVSLLTVLRDWAKGLGYEHCYLDGSMSPARRKKEIARFQEPGGPSLFLISLRAGGVGINLTAADYVILMDPWWNPPVEEQAIDRSHRIGQTQPVTAYRLIASDTVEERIAALQARKKKLAGDLLPDESTIISSLAPKRSSTSLPRDLSGPDRRGNRQPKGAPTWTPPNEPLNADGGAAPDRSQPRTASAAVVPSLMYLYSAMDDSQIRR